LDNGIKCAQVDPKMSMLMSTKIVVQRSDSCRIENKDLLSRINQVL